MQPLGVCWGRGGWLLPEELCGIRSPSRSPPGPVNSGSGPGTDFNSSPRASLPQNIHKLKQRAYPRWSLSNTSLETSSNPTGQQLPHHNLARPSKVLVTWSVESFQDLSPCPQGSPVPRTLGWGKMVDFVGKNRDTPNTHTCTHTRAHTHAHTCTCTQTHAHTRACAHTTQHLAQMPSGVLESVQFSSVSQSCPTLQPHGLQHARPPCPSPTPGAYSNSCPSSR